MSRVLSLLRWESGSPHHSFQKELSALGLDTRYGTIRAVAITSTFGNVSAIHASVAWAYPCAQVPEWLVRMRDGLTSSTRAANDELTSQQDIARGQIWIGDPLQHHSNCNSSDVSARLMLRCKRNGE